jgi:hypothetical protein
MLAHPRRMKRCAGGDRQLGLAVVRMQRRNIARQCRIAVQRHVAGELHRDVVAFAGHVVRQARRRIEHDAAEVGMVAATDGDRDGVVGRGNRAAQQDGEQDCLSCQAEEDAVGAAPHSKLASSLSMSD